MATARMARETLDASLNSILFGPDLRTNRHRLFIPGLPHLQTMGPAPRGRRRQAIYYKQGGGGSTENTMALDLLGFCGNCEGYWE